MIVVIKSTEDIYLGKNQICILCESNEQIPSTFTLDGYAYVSKMAAGIPYDFVQKDITKGSIFEHSTCVISGCDQADSFKKMLVPEESIKQVCKEIWDNPDKYSDHRKGTDDAFYGFLKYLYVTFPDGKEKSLYDVVNS